MALRVGNLLLDPTLNSFISLEDAIAYLQEEQHPAGSATAKWLAQPDEAQEGSLIRASRWMADTLPWCHRDLSLGELHRVGTVAARLAVQFFELDLYAGEQLGKGKKRVKAGSVEVEYFDSSSLTAQAAGQRWPWIEASLRGILCPDGKGARIGLGIYVV